MFSVEELSKPINSKTSTEVGKYGGLHKDQSHAVLSDTPKSDVIAENKEKLKRVRNIDELIKIKVTTVADRVNSHSTLGQDSGKQASL